MITYSDILLDREIETLTFALWRNITAVLLVLALFAQSIRLFTNVVHETFANQVTWDQLGFQINTSVPYLVYVSSIVYGKLDLQTYWPSSRVLIWGWRLLNWGYTWTVRIQTVRLNRLNYPILANFRIKSP